MDLKQGWQFDRKLMKEEEDQDRMSGVWGRSPQASRGSLLVSGGQHSCHTVLSCSVQESRQPRESVQRQGHDESDGGPTLGKCSVRAQHRCSAAASVWAGRQPSKSKLTLVLFCVYSSKMTFHIHAVNNQGR